MKNTQISVFEKCYNSVPVTIDNLYSACTSTYYAETIKLLRSLEKGSKEYDAVKKSLPCFTPSVTCEYRDSQSIVEHSGFICLDFDNIKDPEAVKLKLAQFTFIAFAALSCSGKGLFSIVRIANFNLHKQYCEALADFFCRLGMEVDKTCFDPVRLRFFSYDPTPYYNENATVWNEILPPVQVVSTPPSYSNDDIDAKAIYTIRDYLVSNHIDITSGRYNWMALGSYIIQQLGEATGKSVFREYSQFHPKFDEKDFE